MFPSSQQRRGDGEAAERLAAYAALLREERDPAAIWSIDVSALLDAYLDTLPAATGTQSASERTNVNFAEAALLIQGSASIYGRKADGLHSLVLEALSLFSAGDVGQDGGGARDDGANEESGNEELPFLNLYDLPVLDETDEDGDQAKDCAGGEMPTTHSSRPPFVFLGLGEDNIRDAGVSGDGQGPRTCHEEAQRGLRYRSKYACASSKLDASGAVLLPTLEEDCLPEDAEDWAPRAAPAGCVSGHKSGDPELPRGAGKGGYPEPSESCHQSQGMHDAADDEEGWDGGGLDDWSPPPRRNESPGTADRPRPCGLSGEGEGGSAWGSRMAGEKGMEFTDDPDGEVYDPYKPLDMEDITGGLPAAAEHVWNRPLVPGRSKLKVPNTSTPSWRDSPAFDPLLSSSAPWLETSGLSAPQGRQGSSEQIRGMTFDGPMDAALEFILGGKERKPSSGPTGRRGSETGQGKKSARRAEFEAPSSRGAPRTGSVPEEFGLGQEGGLEEGVGDGLDDEHAWNMDGDDGFGGDDDDGAPSGFGGEQDCAGMGAGREGENISAAGADVGKMDFMDEACTEAEALLRRARERDERHRTGLEKRVAQWQGALLPVLRKEEERGPFDIHQYAERLLGTLERAPQPQGRMTFRDLAKGSDRPEVARSFAAMLHLVNQGNISFQVKDGLSSESEEGSLTQEDAAGASPSTRTVLASPEAFSVSLLTSQRHTHELLIT